MLLTPCCRCALLKLCLPVARRYVARKAFKPSAFPISHWEFTGATAMVELTGYLDVQVPGTYVLAAFSEDRFVLWLQDWWLHMQEAEWGYATWTARANFTAPGGLCWGRVGFCLHGWPCAGLCGCLSTNTMCSPVPAAEQRLTSIAVLCCCRAVQAAPYRLLPQQNLQPAVAATRQQQLQSH